MGLLEKRVFPLRVMPAIEIRGKSGQTVEVLTGRAAVFDEFTEMKDLLGDTFQEQFAAGCMTEILDDGHKIMALFNHDWSGLLGSTEDNLTLALKSDGLYFEFVPKRFEFDRRIAELVRTGTIDGCSIGFKVIRDKWEVKNEKTFHTIEALDLFEVTFTPIPAYAQTAIGIKVREAINGETEATEREERRQILAYVERISSMLDVIGL